MNDKLSPTDKKSIHRKGLVLVFTGDGKGKTTAALGILMRASGRGLSCCVIQFIKSESGKWGEVTTAQKLDIEWHKMGDGFTWLSSDMDETIEKARQGWALAKEKIVSGKHDIILLDEFTYPLHYGWLDSQEVIQWLKENRPESLHLVITGRNAPAELIEYADLVTEMKMIKHPYEQGVLAQAGIEF
jgi:cob(I)alamin adenosyltransferase